jgi:hypothetical protein
VYDLTSVIRLAEDIGDGYHLVHTSLPADSILHESKSLQKLADENWITEVKAVEYAKIGKAAGVTEFYQSMNSEVLKGWKQVYVAGANFDNLEFGYWLRANNFEPESIVPFEKRDGKVIIYTTPECNSKYLQQSDTTYMPRYQEEFEKIIKDRKVLRLRNEFTNTSTLHKSREVDPKNPYCTILKHNMHGLNEYRNSHTVVSFESALNSTRGFVSWMQQRHSIPEEVIFMTRTVDIAYQLIGRTSYRNPGNTEVITAGIPCKRTAHLLAEHYLKDAEIHILDDVTKNRADKIAKKPLKEMTPEERREYEAESKRLRRAKKKAIEEQAILDSVFAGISAAEPQEIVIVEPEVEELQLVLPVILPELSIAEKVLQCNPYKKAPDPDDERETALAKLRARKSEITMKPGMVPI